MIVLEWHRSVVYDLKGPLGWIATGRPFPLSFSWKIDWEVGKCVIMVMLLSIIAIGVEEIYSLDQLNLPVVDVAHLAFGERRWN